MLAFYKIKNFILKYIIWYFIFTMKCEFRKLFNLLKIQSSYSISILYFSFLDTKEKKEKFRWDKF